MVSDPDNMLLGDDKTIFSVAWEEKLTIHISQSPGRTPVCEFILPKFTSHTQIFASSILVGVKLQCYLLMQLAYWSSVCEALKSRDTKKDTSGNTHLQTLCCSEQ
ncbi:hypothetical protein K469DRAFT_387931 [Zopfia rhizophila CBS 207.26]|uniref:Uncharacterized protein n=1 Tax=Zopfia rhizophila CBS 207.26 TaxID=1314779 RepID=A0A6A6EET3_9PEZI|nr:hypothetical protein K469DRAFT_387931 [Zopfia rhizophila CBS 207.26]